MSETPPALFSESELLDVLTSLDGDAESAAESGLATKDVEMEEESSVWGPSVNVVLDGDMFTSEKEFEKFIDALVPDEPTVTRVESKATLSPPPREGEAGVEAKRVPSPAVIQSKPARRSRKHEIDHLRAVAAELEKQLRMLSRSPSLDKPGATQFWKRVSNRLLEQRQQAVVENARLRRLVREQVSAVKTMQRSLAKTPALSQTDVFPAQGQTAVVRRQAVSKELYRGLFLNLSALYSTGIDAMLQQAGIPSPSPDGSRKVNIEMESDANCGLRMCLQVAESRILPFNFRQIGDQAWKYLTDTNGHEHFQLAFQRQGNEIFGRCKLNSSAGPLQLLGDVAVRQYAEANKLTIVWECEGDVHQGDSRTHVQPKGWCVFEPSEDDPEHATIFRRCALLTPVIADGANSDTSIGATTEMVLENYKQTVVYIFDGMLASLGQT